MTDQRDRPSVAGYVANVRDITERKEFEALLAHRALHDPLTGLANRQLILDRAEQMLARSRRTSDPVAALLHRPRQLQGRQRLAGPRGRRQAPAGGGRTGSPAMLRASDTVGRLGGDEFVILTEGSSLAAGPEMVAERIREVLREPFLGRRVTRACPSRSRPASGSPPATARSAQELLRDADIALYRAKAAGRDGWVLFEPAMQSAAVDRLELKSDLDSAARRRPVLPPLPTDLRPRQRHDPGGRGAHPLAAPDPGCHRPRRLHPRARGQRA